MKGTKTSSQEVISQLMKIAKSNTDYGLHPGLLSLISDFPKVFEAERSPQGILKQYKQYTWNLAEQMMYHLPSFPLSDSLLNSVTYDLIIIGTSHEDLPVSPNYHLLIKEVIKRDPSNSEILSVVMSFPGFTESLFFLPGAVNFIHFLFSEPNLEQAASRFVRIFTLIAKAPKKSSLSPNYVVDGLLQVLSSSSPSKESAAVFLAAFSAFCNHPTEEVLPGLEYLVNTESKRVTEFIRLLLSCKLPDTIIEAFMRIPNSLLSALQPFDPKIDLTQLPIVDLCCTPNPEVANLVRELIRRNLPTQTDALARALSVIDHELLRQSVSEICRLKQLSLTGTNSKEFAAFFLKKGFVFQDILKEVFPFCEELIEPVLDAGDSVNLEELIIAAPTVKVIQAVLKRDPPPIRSLARAIRESGDVRRSFILCGGISVILKHKDPYIGDLIVALSLAGFDEDVNRQLKGSGHILGREICEKAVKLGEPISLPALLSMVRFPPKSDSEFDAWNCSKFSEVYEGAVERFLSYGQGISILRKGFDWRGFKAGFPVLEFIPKRQDSWAKVTHPLEGFSLWFKHTNRYSQGTGFIEAGKMTTSIVNETLEVKWGSDRKTFYVKSGKWHFLSIDNRGNLMVDQNLSKISHDGKLTNLIFKGGDSVWMTSLGVRVFLKSSDSLMRKIFSTSAASLDDIPGSSVVGLHNRTISIGPGAIYVPYRGLDTFLDNNSIMAELIESQNIQHKRPSLSEVPYPHSYQIQRGEFSKVPVSCLPAAAAGLLFPDNNAEYQLKLLSYKFRIPSLILTSSMTCGEKVAFAVLSHELPEDLSNLKLLSASYILPSLTLWHQVFAIFSGFHPARLDGRLVSSFGNCSCIRADISTLIFSLLYEGIFCLAFASMTNQKPPPFLRKAVEDGLAIMQRVCHYNDTSVTFFTDVLLSMCDVNLWSSDVIVTDHDESISEYKKLMKDMFTEDIVALSPSYPKPKSSYNVKSFLDQVLKRCDLDPSVKFEYNPRTIGRLLVELGYPKYASAMICNAISGKENPKVFMRKVLLLEPCGNGDISRIIMPKSLSLIYKGAPTSRPEGLRELGLLTRETIEFVSPECIQSILSFLSKFLENKPPEIRFRYSEFLESIPDIIIGLLEYTNKTVLIGELIKFPRVFNDPDVLNGKGVFVNLSLEMYKSNSEDAATVLGWLTAFLNTFQGRISSEVTDILKLDDKQTIISKLSALKVQPSKFFQRIEFNKKATLSEFETVFREMEVIPLFRCTFQFLCDFSESLFYRHSEARAANMALFMTWASLSTLSSESDLRVTSHFPPLLSPRVLSVSPFKKFRTIVETAHVQNGLPITFPRGISSLEEYACRTNENLFSLFIVANGKDDTFVETFPVTFMHFSVTIPSSLFVFKKSLMLLTYSNCEDNALSLYGADDPESLGQLIESIWLKEYPSVTFFCTHPVLVFPLETLMRFDTFAHSIHFCFKFTPPFTLLHNNGLSDSFYETLAIAAKQCIAHLNERDRTICQVSTYEDAISLYQSGHIGVITLIQIFNGLTEAFVTNFNKFPTFPVPPNPLPKYVDAYPYFGQFTRQGRVSSLHYTSPDLFTEKSTVYKNSEELKFMDISDFMKTAFSQKVDTGNPKPIQIYDGFPKAPVRETNFTFYLSYGNKKLHYHKKSFSIMYGKEAIYTDPDLISARSINLSHCGETIVIDFYGGQVKTFQVYWSDGSPSKISPLSEMYFEDDSISCVSGRDNICASAYGENMMIWDYHRTAALRKLSFGSTIEGLLIDEDYGLIFAWYGSSFVCLSISGFVITSHVFEKVIFSVTQCGSLVFKAEFEHGSVEAIKLSIENMSFEAAELTNI